MPLHGVLIDLCVCLCVILPVCVDAASDFKGCCLVSLVAVPGPSGSQPIFARMCARGRPEGKCQLLSRLGLDRAPRLQEQEAPAQTLDDAKPAQR